MNKVVHIFFYFFIHLDEKRIERYLNLLIPPHPHLPSMKRGLKASLFSQISTTVLSFSSLDEKRIEREDTILIMHADIIQLDEKRIES